MKTLSSVHSRQHGAALVTALVLLTIMTILAIAAMSTNTMEEKMAANAQEVNRAFQAGESGLALGFNNDDAFDTSNDSNDNGTPFDFSDDTFDLTQTITGLGTYNAQVTYTSILKQAVKPQRSEDSSQFWGDTLRIYHFELTASAQTPSGLSRTLKGGAYQTGG